jgi:hypothetical protein
LVLPLEEITTTLNYVISSSGRKKEKKGKRK